MAEPNIQWITGLNTSSATFCHDVNGCRSELYVSKRTEPRFEAIISRQTCSSRSSVICSSAQCRPMVMTDCRSGSLYSAAGMATCADHPVSGDLMKVVMTGAPSAAVPA